MSDTPVPRSQAQILGEMIDGYRAATGLRRFRVGSPVLAFLEAASRSVAHSSRDIFRLLASRNLDQTDGSALDDIGADEDVPRRMAKKASGTVTIKDSRYTRIDGKIYPGLPAPIAGSLNIRITTSHLWPATGAIYIGRGTDRVEGPLNYTTAVNMGAYWQITLSTPTSLYHDHGDDVVLAQGGDRMIETGLLVGTPASTLVPQVTYSVIQGGVLPDGEVELSGVRILCTVPGVAGNVAADSITTFPSGVPWTGAVVTNPVPISNGRDTETHEDYRQRIRAVRRSRARATDTALELAVIDKEDETGASIVSAQVVRMLDGRAVMYVDDGAGYEGSTEGVGLETIHDRAVGGESRSQVQNRPIAPVSLTSRALAPFALKDAAQLSVRVGGVVYTHIFDHREFASIGVASAYEVVASINRAALPFMAKTAKQGRAVVITARSHILEDLEIVAAPSEAPQDAGEVLNFPRGRRYSTYLYKNDKLLSKDGSRASIAGGVYSSWGAPTGTQTLTVEVDSTGPITYSITDQDFVDAGVDGYVTVGKNSLRSWAAVLNRKLPGVEVTVEGGRLILSSRSGKNSEAFIAVRGGTLTAFNILLLSEARGVSSDYRIDRGAGQIHLESPLRHDDSLTLGSRWTRAFLGTPSLLPTTLAASSPVWLAVDGGAEPVKHGVTASTTLTAYLHRVTSDTHQIRLHADLTGTDAFSRVKAGDWMVLSSSALPLSLRRTYRVIDVPESGGLYNDIIIEERTDFARRVYHAAVNLQPVGTALSRVLVTGGYSAYQGTSPTIHTALGKGALSTCAIYRPDTGEWTMAASMNVARAGHTATLLSDGRVLVVGGFNESGVPATTTEIYDPATDTWTVGPTMAVGRAYHTATRLTNNRVLIVGGFNGTGPVSTSIEYDPVSNTFINTQTLNTPRYGHGAARVLSGTESGNVIISGGVGTSGRLTACERYNFASPSWSNRASMPTARSFFGFAAIHTGTIVACGDASSVHLGTANQKTFVIYNPNTDSWGINTDIYNSNSWPSGILEVWYEDKNLVSSGGATPTIIGVNGYTKDTNGHFANTSFYFDHTSTEMKPLPQSLWGATSGLERVRVSAVPVTSSGGFDGIAVIGGASIYRGTNAAFGRATSVAEVYNRTTNTWSSPSPFVTAVSFLALPDRGISFVRTRQDVQKITIPNATNYTAPTWAAALNAALRGATASVYRTSRVRLRTNSHDIDDGAILISAHPASQALPLPVGESEKNAVGHLASVASRNTDAGTALGFISHEIGASIAAPDIDSATGIILPGHFAGARGAPYRRASTIYGHRKPSGGLHENTQANARIKEWGDGTRHRSVISSMLARGASGAYQTQGSGTAVDHLVLGLRRAPEGPVLPGHPHLLGGGFALGPEDSLQVRVNSENGTSVYDVPLSREVTTVGSYGSTVTLADTNGATLATAFGTNYDWSDFALYLKARVLSHPTDSTRRALWRYFRHGLDGEVYRVRYTYPSRPDSTVTVQVEHDQRKAVADVGLSLRAGIHIQLGSGARKPNHQLPEAARVGLARCVTSNRVSDVWVLLGFTVIQAQRPTPSGLTRLRLSVPNPGLVANGPQSTGLQAGDVVWLQMNSPTATTAYSGSFAIHSVDPFDTSGGYQDIYIPSNTLHDGTSAWALTSGTIGTISFNSSGETFLDASVAIGDLVRLESTGFTGATSYHNTTMRAVAVARQHLRCRALDEANVGNQTNPTWHRVNVTDAFLTFGGPTQTVSTIVNAVNGIADSPISGVVTGTGAGTIAVATWDELNSASAGYDLTDGLNHIQRYIAPPNVATHTQFVLRDAISSGLGANDDWQNEKGYLVPVLAPTIARWMKTPAVTGLWTVTDIEDTASGQVQISAKTIGSKGSVEILGGTAQNVRAEVIGGGVSTGHLVSQWRTLLVTIPKNATKGFVAGAAIRAQNTISASKNLLFGPTSTVNSINVDGVWTFSVATHGLLAQCDRQRMHVERVGKLVGYHFIRELGGTHFNASDFRPGTYIHITPPSTAVVGLNNVSPANQGVKRILRSSETSFGVVVWVEDSSAVEEVCAARAYVVTADTPVPGDIFDISTDRYGASWRGRWRIVAVGETPTGLYSSNTIRVVPIDSGPLGNELNVPVTMTANSGIRVFEGEPAVYLYELLAAVPAQGDYGILRLDVVSHYERIGEQWGTILTAMDKMDFPSGIWNGVDGYRYHTGLIGVAGAITYGDNDDSESHGYVAAGAALDFDVPQIRRVKISLAVRTQTGVDRDGIAKEVKSRVAAAVNSSGVGEVVAISNVVSAAASVGGVEAVSVTYPSYDSQNDIIDVGPGEKLKIVNLDDVTVVFVSG